MDPNRDFGYDLPEQECMKTTTARLVNELFNEHLFLLSITFHGGDRAIGYPWGAPNHMNKGKSTEAPDYKASDRIASAILNYSLAELKIGPMTDTVYEVKGGMEDWAYAAAWEKAENGPVVKCKSSTYGGYEVREYKDEAFRGIMFLVETDYKKEPKFNLGNKQDVLNNQSGLVPEYIRMSLALIDLAQPHIEVSDPLLAGSKIRVHWRIWGCVTVNETKLNYIPYSPSIVIDNKLIKNKQLKSTKSQSGSCRWGEFTEFSEELELEGEYLVFVTAVVDQNWKEQKNPDPAVLPQTHIVRMRTSDDYYTTNGKWTLRGDKIWKSEGIKFTFKQNNQNTQIISATIYNALSFQAPIGVLQISQPSESSSISIQGTFNIDKFNTIQLISGTYGDIRYPVESSFGSIYDIPEPYCTDKHKNEYSTSLNITFSSCNPIDVWVGNSIIVMSPEFEILGAGVVSSELMTKEIPSTGGICTLVGSHGYLGNIVLKRVGEGVEMSGYLVIGYYKDVKEVEIKDDQGNSISLKLSKKSEVFRIQSLVVKIDTDMIGKRLSVFSHSNYDGECIVGSFNPHFYDYLLDESLDSDYKRVRNNIIYLIFGLFALGLAGIFLFLFYRSKKKYTPVLQDANLELEEFERTI